jgi:hypothetical protein
LETGIRRIMAPCQPDKKIHKTLSQAIAGCGGMCLSSQATWEAEIRRIVDPPPTKKSLQDLISTEKAGPLIPAMVGNVK